MQSFESTPQYHQPRLIADDDPIESMPSYVAKSIVASLLVGFLLGMATMALVVLPHFR